MKVNNSSNPDIILPPDDKDRIIIRYDEHTLICPKKVKVNDNYIDRYNQKLAESRAKH